MRRTAHVLGGRYRLDSPIAAGGVGEVWRAADLVLDRPVAVKVLRSEYAGQRQALARFRAEARQAGSLSHPAIAQIYDYDEVGAAEAPYLVMELVDGPSLADLLAAGPLDPGTTMDVLAQAASGLQAAHAAGLVHRDIKPGNLLIGPGGQVKITDFGIAHAAGAVPITRTGMVIGTPSYLAPERAAGGQASPASDLYSLGIVGYECLSGEPPFSGMPLEVTAAHQHRELPPLPSSVPAEAAGLVRELTAKDPASRPASAAVAAERAVRVRDSLTGGAPSRLAATATAPFRSDPDGGRSGTLVDAHPLTWHNAHAVGRGDRRPWRGRGVLVALGAALVGGLATWLVTSAMPAAHQSPPAPSAPAASSPAIQTVEVNSADLVGQQVSDVNQTLQNLGLTPIVTFISSRDGGQDGQVPGTVVSVSPSGLVPVGSPVTVTVFQGHQHDHGNGGGGGGGDGGN
ncbi:MAG TPA: serine/threonine protein kinase [Streptosporangiaceae bacterium]